jgi:hypothetical protein|nr:MAG TPA: hypothetical protein [Caudoviricetes sp.]
MIGSLGDIIFYASDLNVFSLKKELSRSRKAKITQHEPIYGIGKVRQQGRELMEVSLSIELIAGLTKAPSLHLQMLKDFMELGRYAPLILGYHIIGEFPFLITGIDETLSHFNAATGEFDYINLDITLLEYVDDPLQYQKKIEYRQTAKTILGVEYEDTVKNLQKKVFKL